VVQHEEVIKRLTEKFSNSAPWHMQEHDTSGIIKWKADISIAVIHWTADQRAPFWYFHVRRYSHAQTQPSHEETTHISPLPLASEITRHKFHKTEGHGS